jgi:putative hemolysin
MMVDQGGESGVIEDAQKEMINNIFEFDDTAVSEIMTHRTEIIGIEADAPLRDAVEASIKEGCSRLPVYEEDLDSVVGIVYVKDLLKYITCDLPAAETPRAVMRTPYFVPESMRCRELFKEMTTRRMQIAIVVDEYGGTAGLVTLEDILESIVGEIQDEYDDEEEDIAKINETTFLLDGATSLEEVEALTHVTLPEGEYETIAGFVLRELGYLPAADEIPPDVAFANLKFTIKEIKDKRLSSIQVEITPPV